MQCRKPGNKQLETSTARKIDAAIEILHVSTRAKG
jgi:hypothetical protein